MSDVYVRYSNKPVARTLDDTRAGITVDLDEAGEVVGVELLGGVSVTVDGRILQWGPLAIDGDAYRRRTRGRP